MADHQVSHILLLSPYRTCGCISGIIWFKEVRKNFSRGQKTKKSITNTSQNMKKAPLEIN